MPLYTYTAENSSRDTVHGTIDSLSIDAARRTLEATRLTVLEVHEATLTEQSSLTHAIEGHPNVTPLSSWTAEDEETPGETKPRRYHPIVKTARLYAGWLLAWYFLVITLASYQITRPLSFRIPYIEALLESPLVHFFTLSAFLFLLLSSIHQKIGKGWISAAALGVVGVAMVYVYQVNSF